jgi:glycerate dehydrogenase
LLEMGTDEDSLGVFLDLDSVNRDDLDLSGLRDTLPSWRLYETRDPTPVAERIESATVVVTNKVVLDADLLEAARSHLRLICVAATGTNNVDLKAAAALGIPVCNARGYGTPSVVQHVFALILALSTRLLDYETAARDGRWARSPFFCLLDFPIREIAGLELGIVGYGELGRAVAQVAEAFGMRVLISQRPGGPERPGRVPFDELLDRVDVLSLHCPLTPETRGLIDARALSLMREEALLINTARGGIVDEAALAAALREGRLGGAGIDVLASEPPVPGVPLLACGIPNLILTPHIAWASRASRQRLLDDVAENIRAYRTERPRNLVT